MKSKYTKHKRGEKLTIEIAEVHTHYSDNGEPYSVYRVKGFNSMFLDDYAIRRIKEQTECKTDRLVKCMEGHTVDYTDGYYAGNKAGIEASVMATKTKVIPATREKAIRETLMWMATHGYISAVDIDLLMGRIVNEGRNNG